MHDEVTGYFDGRAIVPDRPLQLRPGQKLRVHIETVDSNERYPLEILGEMAIDMGTETLSVDHTKLASPDPCDTN